MGWFADQIKQRRKNDEEAFEKSFSSLIGIGINNQNDFSEQEIKDTFVIGQILSYFNYQLIDVPSKITSFMDKVNYVVRSYDILYRKIQLKDTWMLDNRSPILAFTKVSKTPVVLLPKGNSLYYYINYQTGKKKLVSFNIIDKLEVEAFSFYRQLPNKKLSIKEYANYIRKSLRISDIIFVIMLSGIAIGVGLLLPYLTKKLTGEVIESKDINQFINLSIYIIATATGVLLIKAIQGLINSRVGIKIEKSVQEATMMRLLSLPTSFFKKYSTGELTSRFNSVTRLSTLINGIIVTLISALMSIIYLFQLSSFASSLIIPVIIILLISTIFTVVVSFVQKNVSSKQLNLYSKVSGITYETINGIQKIRLTGSEKRIFVKWADAYLQSAKLLYNPPFVLRLSSVINLIITLFGSIMIYIVATKNNVSVSDYMAFVTGYGMLSAAFSQASNISQTIAIIPPVLEMARPILEEEPETSYGKINVKNLNGNIRLENVSFRYNDNSPLIIDNLSINIKEGEYVAVVGKTGCGKSTLVRLLLGFEKPVDGHIYYDENNIDDVDLALLRKNIGTVLQNGTLFHADILSNIIISAPELKEEDAWEAAKIASIDKDISEMPMGMKTIISEGQGGISGGQKQRIMIARAIVHKPKILIFDEATSALDNKTQKSISKSLSELNCTRIVIAHRLSTIQNADRIIVLDGGKIIEDGDYQTLLNNKGEFAKLVARQRLDNKF